MCTIDESMEIIYRTPEPIKENNGMYYIQIEMVDGTSQILQICKEQAVQLGIDLSGETPAIAQNCPEKNPQMQEVIIDANGFLLEQGGNETVTEYRILQPEEMNLKPLKKGANKESPKRLAEDIIIVKPAKKIKTVRTRSGRVTVPPKHIQDIYKQFLEKKDSRCNGDDTTNATDTAEVSRSPSPLLIGDFTPLKTNGEDVAPVETAESAPKPTHNKNVIVNQYRCATCNKAYLAKRKMRKHFKMHPDHKPKDTLNAINSRTWNYLIDTSKAAAVGKRGIKFCRELVNLLHNVKVLVKYVFKLQKKLDGYDDLTFKAGDTNEKGQYLMNDVLAELLGIDKGWYTFNDKEWFKDVSIFSFLNNFDSSGDLSALSINDNSDDMTGNSTKITHKINDKEISSEAVDVKCNNNDEENVVLVIKSGLNQNSENLIAKVKEEQLINNNKTNEMSKNDELFSKFLNKNMRLAKQNTAADKNMPNAAVKDNTEQLVDEKTMISCGSNPIVAASENSAGDNAIIQMLVDDSSLLAVDNSDKPPLEIFQFDSNQ